jgi:hypothetical protein
MGLRFFDEMSCEAQDVKRWKLLVNQIYRSKERLILFTIYPINTNCDGAAGEFGGSEQQLSLEDFQQTPVDKVLVATAHRTRVHSVNRHAKMIRP